MSKSSKILIVKGVQIKFFHMIKGQNLVLINEPFEQKSDSSELIHKILLKLANNISLQKLSINEFLPVNQPNCTHNSRTRLFLSSSKPDTNYSKSKRDSFSSDQSAYSTIQTSEKPLENI